MIKPFSNIDEFESTYSDNVWKGVEAHLNKKRRSRWVLFGLILLGALAVSYSIYHFVTNNAQEPLIEYSYLKSDVGDSVDVDRNSISVGNKAVVINNFVLNENRRSSNNVLIDSNEVYIPNNVSYKYASTPQIYLKKKEYIHQSVAKAKKIAKPFAVPRNTISSIASNVRIQNNLVFNDSKACPKFSPDNFVMYAWSQLGFGLPYSRFKAREQTHNAFADLRSQTENPLISPHFSIGVGFRHKSGLFAETGIELSHWREQFEYSEVTNQTVIVIDTIITQVDTLIAMDTTSMELVGKQYSNINSRRNVSLPLFVGYRHQLNNKLYLGLKGGAVLNLISETKGTILNNFSQPVPIVGSDATTQNIVNTDRLGILLSGGMELGYSVSPNIDAYVATSMSYTLRSVTQDKYPLEQRFLIPSFQVGTKIYLN